MNEHPSPKLWHRSQLNELTLDSERPDHPPFEKIAIGVDPPLRSCSEDPIGIVVVAKAAQHLVVIADFTGLMTMDAAYRAASKLAPQCVMVAEKLAANMVRTMMQHIDPEIRVSQVSVTRGIWHRAEKLSGMYAADMVQHLKHLSVLETEMCLLTPSGQLYGTMRRPERLDALTIAIEYLTAAPSSFIRNI